MTKKNEAKTLSEKIARIDEISAWFDSQEFDIEEAIKMFEEGAGLLKEVKADLASKKLAVEKIKNSA